ncbi:serine hydrolase [Phenylobacterium sp. LjRoot219]|uniref:serine hydrolase domain-containing protein n=1 Tax=Phenylobacterium sp. LjRoot219 TaxID=3342283 RepID=UPI003ECC9C32
MTLSETGVARLQALLEDHVAQCSAPGLVGLLSRGEETRIVTAGRMSLDDGAAPMPWDAIFRLASMTKPVTAAAALMLIEDGKLSLDEPVERLLPELAGRRVLRTLASPLDDTVPAERPITVADVFTFRLGWGVLFDPDLPIQAAVADLPGFGMPDPTSPLTPDAYMARLADLPLMAQPGARWLYTVGSNVLGVLVARAAGQPLDVFIQERILGPLGMIDTGFWIPPEKIDRTVTGYFPQDGKLELFDAPDGRYTQPPVFPAGDSGLVATADDFGRFARFLLTGRAPDGRQLLSPASLRLMQTNALTEAQMDDGREILGPGWGWGLGVGVQVGENPYGIARGAYGWNGGFGTSWFNDPANGLVAILLTQRVFDGPDPPQLHKDFWRAAYAAMA